MTDRVTHNVQSKRLKKRYQAEKRFKFFGIAAIFSAAAILLVAWWIDIYVYPAFTHHYVTLDISIPETTLSNDQISDAKLFAMLIGAVKCANPSEMNSRCN